MKTRRFDFLGLLLLGLIAVACSTTRKTVEKEETLTQISEIKADSGSLHATHTTTTSTQKDSWEEIVIEWGEEEPAGGPGGNAPGTGAEELQGTASQNATGAEISELEKTINAIRKSGAKKATLKKGHSEASSSQMQQETNQTEKRQEQTQSQAEKRLEQEQIRTSKTAEQHILGYLMFIAIAAGFIYLTRSIIKRL